MAAIWSWSQCVKPVLVQATFCRLHVTEHHHLTQCAHKVERTLINKHQLHLSKIVFIPDNAIKTYKKRRLFCQGFNFINDSITAICLICMQNWQELLEQPSSISGKIRSAPKQIPCVWRGLKWMALMNQIVCVLLFVVLVERKDNDYKCIYFRKPFKHTIFKQ